jgi:PST family polysaccharide transporter
VASPTDAPARRREDLRGRAARGTVINAAFLVGFNLLGFLRGFAVAAFLTTEDYGIWGLLIAALATLAALSAVGVDDKYVQQEDADQEIAFQRAFTLQVALNGLLLAVIVVALPLFALLYGEWEIVLPGYVLALALPAVALQAPLWTFYRDMEFARQRRLQAFDPVVSLVVTIGLAAAGAGYWALVAGGLAGAWAAAAAAVRASPYPLRLRWARGTVREYAGFSGPLALSALAGVLVGLIPILVAQRSLGLAAVGAIAVASTISAYANRVDEIVTDTLYPAICAVRDRPELLRESFLKSNRLALLWAVPAAGAIALFADDIVDHLLGDRWEVAAFLLQAFAVAAALNQVAFNWTAFYRARGETRPVAVVAAATLGAVVVLAVPLLLWRGVDGFGVGMVLATLAAVGVRLRYAARLFGWGVLLANTARGIAPALPAVAAILLFRWAEGGDAGRSPARALLELAVYGVLAAACTLVSERALLREVRGYLVPA